MNSWGKGKVPVRLDLCNNATPGRYALTSWSLTIKTSGDDVQVVYTSDTCKAEYSTRSMAAFELESRHSKIAKDLKGADINRRKADI
jgi:hypothetical protein